MHFERSWKLATGAISLAGTLALSGCSSGSNDPETPSETLSLPSATTTTQSPSNTSLPSSSSSETPNLIFDDLGGGSSIIRVYAGAGSNSQDLEANGTYNDGDAVPAECKTTGRTIESDISLGEEERTSNAWIRITGTPGEVQYATAVYVQNPDELLAQLPEC